MGSFLLLSLLQGQALAGSSALSRTEVPLSATVPSSTGPHPEPAISKGDHRWLHPHGPAPPAWDGDWPEEDLRAVNDPEAPGRGLSPNLPLRLCFCPEVHGTLGHLPGVGATHLGQEVP